MKQANLNRLLVRSRPAPVDSDLSRSRASSSAQRARTVDGSSHDALSGTSFASESGGFTAGESGSGMALSSRIDKISRTACPFVWPTGRKRNGFFRHLVLLFVLYTHNSTTRLPSPRPGEAVGLLGPQGEVLAWVETDGSTIPFGLVVVLQFQVLGQGFEDFVFPEGLVDDAIASRREDRPLLVAQGRGRDGDDFRLPS